jgi:hypothetical protein
MGRRLDPWSLIVDDLSRVKDGGMFPAMRGGAMFPAPMADRPEFGARVWLVDVMAMAPVSTLWTNSHREQHYLRSGLIHAGRESAARHREYLIWVSTHNAWRF